MNGERAKRKLAAILSADVKGYSRLMGEDELATVETLKLYREVMGSLIQQYNGRVVDSPGDNLLADFASVVEAVECAVKIQEELKLRNAEFPEDRRMAFRIGVNLGDVLEDEGRIYGDGVNIAARVESLSDAGGVCLSGSAYDQVKSKLKLELGYEFLGEQSVKNISEPVRIYRVLAGAKEAGTVVYKHRRDDPKHKRRSTIIVLLILIFGIAGFVAYKLYQTSITPPVELASIEKMAFPLPDKPSIAVLPFDNMSGDPEQEYIADGFTENIITALSKIPEMFVIARYSVFTYKGKPVKIQRVSEDLGVQYVLEGSVQRSADRIRIAAQLIDATTGHHLWADRYDRDFKDLFDLQDEITMEILTALQVKLTEGEQAASWQTTNNLEAWGYFVKASGHFERFQREDNIRAKALFEKAVSLDPNYSAAWLMLAWTHLMDAYLGFGDSRAESMTQAMALAEKVRGMVEGQSEAHALWNTIHLFQKQYELAIAEGRKSVTLGPNNSLGHILFAYTMLFAGEFNEAIDLAERAIRLTPYCSSWYFFVLGKAYRQAGRYEEAFAAFEKGLVRARENRGNLFLPLIGLTDVSVQLGRDTEARNYAADILKIDPNFNLEGFKYIYLYKDPAHLERILDNMRKAGLPERAGDEVSIED